MGRQAITIKLSKTDRKLLLDNTKPRVQLRYVQRARVILLAADSVDNNEIAERVGLSFVSVSKWRTRYAKQGIVGLKDTSGRGRKRRLSHDQILKVAEVACKPPPHQTHWSARRLAKELGFVRKSQVHKILRSFDVKPHQSKMWCFSNDPDFEKKKADIIGLYLRPPRNAFVVCIDEKPGIQAISRTIRGVRSGSPELSNHEYKRNGTVDLFAAFRVNDGKVIGKIESRHRAVEFLNFMKIVYRRWGRKSKQLHIVLDNLATHEVKLVQEWLAANKNVHFHFTPTHASWLNQIEIWFAIIQQQAIRRGTFDSTTDLGQKLMSFIDDYNTHAKPFAWCYGQPLKA
mgnify:CR=1 FL=1